MDSEVDQLSGKRVLENTKVYAVETNGYKEEKRFHSQWRPRREVKLISQCQ